MLGVVARAATDCHPQSFGVREVPMAALAAPVHKAGFFQVGDQLSHFARHSSIKIVSQRFADVKQEKSAKGRDFFHGGAEGSSSWCVYFLMLAFRAYGR